MTKGRMRRDIVLEISSEARRSQTEARKYAGSCFIEFDELKAGGPVRECIAVVREGQFGKLEITFEDGRKLGLNGTSVGTLMRDLGGDTDDWIRHEIEVYAGSVQYQGSPKDAALVRTHSTKASSDMDDKIPF